jgi:hypothetical protein
LFIFRSNFIANFAKFGLIIKGFIIIVATTIAIVTKVIKSHPIVAIIIFIIAIKFTIMNHFLYLVLKVKDLLYYYYYYYLCSFGNFGNISGSFGYLINCFGFIFLVVA